MTSKTIKTKRPVTRKSAMFFLTLALIITSLLYLFPLLWFLLSA
ncbi:carbohydrate ABC transporter permease, partial [Listeria monocytogenes]|nr:carbohydrate ABC transporter permease [Listeria monocytogenes]